MKFKFKPVAWMAGVFAVLSALIGANELYPVIPEKAMPWVLFAEAVLALILGRQVHNRVTPLAAPRAANGRTLVPTPPARVPPDASPFALDATQE